MTRHIVLACLILTTLATRPHAANPPPPLIDEIRLASAKDRREILCIAYTVYVESRATPEKDGWLVANSIMNRVALQGFPRTPCGVINHRMKNAFRSQYVDITAVQIHEPDAWIKSQRIAYIAFQPDRLDPPECPGVTHFITIGRSRRPPPWVHNPNIEVACATKYHVYYRLVETKGKSPP